MEIVIKIKKRGLIFSLDAAIAVTVVVIILITSAYYLSTASKESTSQVQLIKIGNDLLTIFEKEGVLDWVVANDSVAPSDAVTVAISESIVNVSRYLPASYNALIEVSDIRETPLSNVATGITCVSSPPCCFGTGCNGSFNVTTLPLTRANNYHVIAHASSTFAGKNSSISLHTPGKIFVFATVKERTYVTTSPHSFEFGINRNLMFNATNMLIDWFRVLGDKSYAANTSRPLPSNFTFIGTGERLFAYVIKDIFDQPRYAKFYIWIE